MSSRDRRVQLTLIGVIVVAVAVGALQSVRLDHMRRVENFYRWVVSAATQNRVGGTLELDEVQGAPEPLDDELFDEVVQLAEERLPDIPVEEADLDEDGEPYSKLLRAVRQNIDEPIYRMLASAEGRELRDHFMTYLEDGRLLSAGTQLTTGTIYGEEAQAAGVGLTSLFFGFRKVAANFLWLQVDKFWHQGQMHRMVPMMRTTVTLDPNFVDAYLLGAWHLAYNLTAQLAETPEHLKVWNPKYQRRLGRKEEWYYVAADFLKDGIRKNPRDYRLYFDLGYAIYENKLGDHENAVRYLTEARRYKHDQWVPRMLYRSMWLNGQYQEAIDGWLEYLEHFPDSHQARRFLQINRGYLHEAKSEDATKCAEGARQAAENFRLEAAKADAAGDAPAAEELRGKAQEAELTAVEMEQFAEEEWEEAREIYLAMIQESDDSIAKARMYRHTALEWVDEGRHYEATLQLDMARYEMLQSFDELSNLIIKIKLDGDLDLTVSEKLAIERAREAAAYRRETDSKRRRYIDCPYEFPEEVPFWEMAESAPD